MNERRYVDNCVISSGKSNKAKEFPMRWINMQTSSTKLVTAAAAAAAVVVVVVVFSSFKS